MRPLFSTRSNKNRKRGYVYSNHPDQQRKRKLRKKKKRHSKRFNRK